MTRRPPPAKRVTGRASRAVGHLLDGEPRRGRVVAAMRSAVYVETADETAPVFAVVTSDAIRVPVGVVLDAPSEQAPFAGLQPGAGVSFGHRTVRLDRLSVAVTSQWTPPRPQVADPGTAVRRATELQSLVDRHALPIPAMLEQPFARLRSALRDDGFADCEQAATGLIGLGPGLTPSGDDLVCATLVARVALPGHARATGGLRAAVASASGRTTTVSAALLHRASAGEAIEQVADLLDALGSGADLRAPLAALLDVGHHSGSDLARGLAVALAPFAGAGTPATTSRSV